MEISKVPGTSSDEKDKRWFFEFWQQWDAFLAPSRMSWIDFTFIKIAGEFARYKGSWEFDVCLLGLGMRVTYIYDRQFVDDMSDLRDTILADLQGATGATAVEDPTGALDQFKGKPAPRS